MHLKIFVPGVVVAQPRAKVSTRGGFARAYVPKAHPIHAWRDMVHVIVQAKAHEDWPVRKPAHVLMGCVFYKLRPKSVKIDRSWITKPDGDNLYKAVADSLEGVVYERDSQIRHGSFTKCYCEHSTAEGVAISVDWTSSDLPY